MISTSTPIECHSDLWAETPTNPDSTPQRRVSLLAARALGAIRAVRLWTYETPLSSVRSNSLRTSRTSRSSVLLVASTRDHRHAWRYEHLCRQRRVSCDSHVTRHHERVSVQRVSADTSTKRVLTASSRRNSHRVPRSKLSRDCCNPFRDRCISTSIARVTRSNQDGEVSCQ